MGQLPAPGTPAGRWVCQSFLGLSCCMLAKLHGGIPQTPAGCMLQRCSDSRRMAAPPLPTSAGLQVLQIDTKTNKPDQANTVHLRASCAQEFVGLLSSSLHPVTLGPQSTWPTAMAQNAQPDPHAALPAQRLAVGPALGLPGLLSLSRAHAGGSAHSSTLQGLPLRACKALSRWQRSQPPRTLEPLRLTANIASASACGAQHCSVRATTQPRSMHTSTAVPLILACPWPQGAVPSIPWQQPLRLQTPVPHC